MGSVLLHRLAQGEGAISPAPAWGRKQQGRVLMGEPPLTQLLDHGSSDGHESILASLAIANVQAGWVFTAMDVTNLNADGLAHAQTAVIHQPQAGAKTRLLDRLQHLLDFGARQDNGQDFRLRDP